MPNFKQNDFVREIIKIVRSKSTDAHIKELLSDYHENDIADALVQLTKAERLKLYTILGAEWASDVLTYIDYPEEYFEELGVDRIAEVINEMDSDDAVELLENLDDETKEKLRPKLDEDVKADIRLITSYDEDEIGSLITNNFVCIPNCLTIRQAMHELVVQAGENDNVSTIYVKDENGCFFGAIDLKDLIRARENDSLISIISESYPSIGDKEKIADCIEKIKDYAEDSLPVVDENNKLIGIITAQSVIETVDEEMVDDYAKLAGLTEAEDLKESLGQSMRKRLPWLIILLFLGIVVSTVVGAFESVVAVLPIVMCFQSLILDMAGSVGTQSLAVTIRVLMDEAVSGKEKAKLVFKEGRVGFFNGLLLGAIAFVFVGGYNLLFKETPWQSALLISGCVGVSMLMSMLISSLVGTLIPMFFHKIKVDPAVASGPLITTVNDLVAVVTYYGLSWILLINIFHLG